MPERAALYVDGFNLYHAINDDLQMPHLKWLDLFALGKLIIPKASQELVRVVWCTAIKKNDVARMLRHRQYVKVLRASGVVVLEGHFADEDRDCRGCGRRWKKPTEKQGDVNLAISIIDDAHQDVIDHVYLLTADSDQAATAKLFRERFPHKSLTTLNPPGRSHSKEILSYAAKIGLDETHLARCLFPKHVIVNGQPIASRPPEYDPPKGWKRPSEPKEES